MDGHSERVKVLVILADPLRTVVTIINNIIRKWNDGNCPPEVTSIFVSIIQPENNKILL